MAILNIKDPEAQAVAAELAQSDQRRLIARVLDLGRRASSRPVLDLRNPEQILGYDGFGAPRSR